MEKGIFRKFNLIFLAIILIASNLVVSCNHDSASEVKELTDLKQIGDDMKLTYQNRVLKLRDYFDGWYYFQGDYFVMRTDDLTKPTTSWQIIANTKSIPEAGIYPFLKCRIVGNELLISAKQNAKIVFFFIDLETLKPRSVTFDGVTDNKIVTSANGDMNIGWSNSKESNIWVFNLYDTSKLGQRGEAQKIYISKNYGKSFSKIFDYDQFDFSKMGLNNMNKGEFHIHGVCYDTFWKRIWAVTGDGYNNPDNTAILWSDDYGNTWKAKRLTVDDMQNQRFQAIGIISLKEGLILVSDDDKVGTCFINRNNKENFSISKGAIFSPNSLYSYGRNFINFKNVTYISFGQEPNFNLGSFVLGTQDGKNYKKVLSLSDPSITDAHFWIVRDDSYIYLNLNNSGVIRKYEVQ